jgi:hypothetical protein
MATVYKSKKTGEYGVHDDAGNFSWVSRDQAKEVCEAGPALPVHLDDGEPMDDGDPLWNDLLHITGIVD